MTDSISSTSAAALMTDYMELLVTQLSNQNPLDPMDNEALTAQLTSLSQLQLTEEMNTNFSSLLQYYQMSEGQGMIGRLVTFTPETLGEEITGLVSAVTVDDGVVSLTVGPYSVELDDVQAILPYSSSYSSSTEAESELIGDVNLDNTVDDSDLAILQENIGLTTGAVWAQGDMDGDGDVDYTDYSLLMENYGESIESDDEVLGDLNGDGTVDYEDISILLNNLASQSSDANDDSNSE